MNMVLNALRDLCKKRGIDLYMAFIDIKKTYDTVDRGTMWKILHHFGFPPNLINLIKYLYDNSKSMVQIGKAKSKYFNTTAGLKQGYPLSEHRLPF